MFVHPQVLPDTESSALVRASAEEEIPYSHYGAQEIVTFNLKDFPGDTLMQYGIEAIHPDLFVERQLDLHQGSVIATAKQHRKALKNPPKMADEYIEALVAQGLAISADRFRDFSLLWLQEPHQC